MVKIVQNIQLTYGIVSLSFKLWLPTANYVAFVVTFTTVTTVINFTNVTRVTTVSNIYFFVHYGRG